MAKKKLKSTSPAPTVAETPSTADSLQEHQPSSAPSAALKSELPQQPQQLQHPQQPQQQPARNVLLDSDFGVLAVLGLIFGLLCGLCPGSWVILLAFLMGTAVCVLGLDNAKQMRDDVLAWHLQARVPLTDAVLDMTTANKFANSCQVREKSLKILQYVLRGGAYYGKGLLNKELCTHLKALSKTTSIARRFFKFCRWVKHFEDLAEAHDEKDGTMRFLLYFRVAANFGADWAEDVCSLERIGILPKGTLSVSFMLFAEYCQLALALVEISVTTVRSKKEEAKTKALETKGDAAGELIKQQRKFALVRLELIKFVSDVGKAVFDCELTFSHEGVFIGCSLFSAILSTHKNMVKVLK